MSIKVTKRNGNIEDLDISKIRQCISYACENLDVDPLSLESLFSENLFDGVTTSAIHENLIVNAKALCSGHQPDWVFVAGRLETMKLWAEHRSYDIEFSEFFNEMIEQGLWVHPNLSKYTPEEIQVIGTYIDQSRDLGHSYASVITARQKYLLPGECIQHIFIGNAMIVAQERYEGEEKLEMVKLIYDRYSERELSQATPWLGNLRSGGNISSCFTNMPDDNLDSIYRTLTRSARISKSGGGIGTYFGKIRAKGSSLMGTNGLAGGTQPFMRLYNDTAVAVNQGGKRAGAITIALPIWHADIEDFIECQTEKGDPRSKLFDIQPQITCPDLFMELTNEDTKLPNWHTFCPYEVKKVLGIDITESYNDRFREDYETIVHAKNNGLLTVGKHYNAKALLKMAMATMFETGLPYTAFTDAINRANPNKHEGNIYCTNLCTESFSNMKADEYDHTCNLLSLVVGRLGMAKLEQAAYDAVIILDAGIDLTRSPNATSQNHNQRYRTIGIGIQGLHDIIALEGSHYFDEKFIKEVAERIQYGAVRSSIDLAKRFGYYPAFPGSDWDNGTMINKFYKNSVVYGDKWLDLQKEINRYGIRNSQLTSPAPNTSTSLFMDAAAGVMPVWSAFFYDDNTSGPLPVASMHLKLNPLSYARDLTRFNPWDLTKPVGWLQKFVDTGISAEYLMDKNRDDFKAKFLWDVIQNAWKNENKAVYYIRNIKKGEAVVKTQTDYCAGCAG